MYFVRYPPPFLTYNLEGGHQTEAGPGHHFVLIGPCSLHHSSNYGIFNHVLLFDSESPYTYCKFVDHIVKYLYV